MGQSNCRGWQAGRAAIGLCALATAAVFLRFVAKKRRKLKLEIDDWLALAALIVLGALLAELILWITVAGMGNHILDLSLQEVQAFIKILLSIELTYAVLTPLVKLSVICYYRRIFGMTSTFMMIADCVMGMCISCGVAALLSAAFQCRPLRAFWDLDIQGHCFNSLKYFFGVQSVNIFLDIIILCLPMKMVWSLRRPWQERLAVSGVFLLGGFVVFSSVYRIVAITEVKRDDISYSIDSLSIWTFVEPAVGLTCGCLPTIRTMFPAYRVKAPARLTAERPRFRKGSGTPYGSYSGGYSEYTVTTHRGSDCGMNCQTIRQPPPGRIMVTTVIEVV